jgi:hypothetical protein
VSSDFTLDTLLYLKVVVLNYLNWRWESDFKLENHRDVPVSTGTYLDQGFV